MGNTIVWGSVVGGLGRSDNLSIDPKYAGGGVREGTRSAYVVLCNISLGVRVLGGHLVIYNCCCMSCGRPKHAHLLDSVRSKSDLPPMYPGCAACVMNQRIYRGHGHRRCNAKDNAPPRAATYGAVYPVTRRGGIGVCPPLEVTHEVTQERPRVWYLYLASEHDRSLHHRPPPPPVLSTVLGSVALLHTDSRDEATCGHQDM